MKRNKKYLKWKKHEKARIRKRNKGHKKKRKYVIMTVSFEEKETLQKLREMAKKNHVSVQTMIRRVLRKQMELDELALKAKEEMYKVSADEFQKKSD